MTMIAYHASDRSRSRPSSFASFLRPTLLVVEKLRSDWRRRQTEKMLESLPAEVRKDIGWPTTNVSSNRR